MPMTFSRLTDFGNHWELHFLKPLIWNRKNKNVSWMSKGYKLTSRYFWTLISSVYSCWIWMIFFNFCFSSLIFKNWIWKNKTYFSSVFCKVYIFAMRMILIHKNQHLSTTKFTTSNPVTINTKLKDLKLSSNDSF